MQCFQRAQQHSRCGGQSARRVHIQCLLSFPCVDPSLALSGAIIATPTSFLSASSSLHPAGPWDFFIVPGPEKKQMRFLPHFQPRTNSGDPHRLRLPKSFQPQRDNTETERGAAASVPVPGPSPASEKLREAQLPLDTDKGVLFIQE